jgi:hypothetical protein
MSEQQRLLADWVTKAYESHSQWAERLHALHDRLIQLNTETAAVLREISAAERNEQSSRAFVQETFTNWRLALDLPGAAQPEETQQ